MAKKKQIIKERVILAGIPGQFWQLHELKNNRAGDVIEEFQTKREAFKYAKSNNLIIIKTESHSN